MVHHRVICAGDADADDQTLLVRATLTASCVAIGPYRRAELVVLARSTVLALLIARSRVRGNAVFREAVRSFLRRILRVVLLEIERLPWVRPRAEHDGL